VSPLCDARLARSAWSVSSVYTQTWRRAHRAVARRGLIYTIPTRARDDIAGQTTQPDYPTHPDRHPPLQPSSVAGRSGAPPIHRSSPPPSPVAMDEAKGTALSMLALLLARDRFAEFCDPRSAPANSAPDRVDLVFPCRTRPEIRRAWGALRELGSCFVREWVWGWESVRIRR
jgi:hypothetical protein